MPVAMPVSPPTGGGGGICCLWSSHSSWPTDACAPCDEIAKAGTYCAKSKYNCEVDCKNAAWCGH